MLGTHTYSRPAARMSGFTLVELMVTLFIASILLAVGVPSFNRMMITSRVTAQSNELVAALNFARSEAIKRNVSMTLCRAAAANSDGCTSPTTGDWQFWIVRPVTPADAEPVRRGVINEAAQSMVVRSTLAGDQVVYGSDGLARTGGAVVDDHEIDVCSTRSDERETRRRVVLGAGSRLITESFEGDC
jgi:type IV fimbrial biogenesis protein FimT